jgi:hypothetical protein
MSEDDLAYHVYAAPDGDLEMVGPHDFHGQLQGAIDSRTATCSEEGAAMSSGRGCILGRHVYVRARPTPVIVLITFFLRDKERRMQRDRDLPHLTG